MRFGFHWLLVGGPALFAIIALVAAVGGGSEYADGWWAFVIFGLVALGASLYVGRNEAKAAQRKDDGILALLAFPQLDSLARDTVQIGDQSFPVQWWTLGVIGGVILILVGIVYFGRRNAAKKRAEARTGGNVSDTRLRPPERR